MKRHIIIPLCLAPLIAAALEVTLPAAEYIILYN